MHPIKVLSKLSLGTVNLKGSSGGVKTLDTIDWQSAAHAMAGLSKEASNWAYFRFAGQDSKYKTVYRSLSMNIALFIKIRRYKIQPETLSGLIDAAIYETIRPLKICKKCEGFGVIKSEETPKICQSCNGDGIKPFSKNERCKIIGINHKSYSTAHESISHELIRLIGTWEEQIIRHMNIKLGDVA